MGRTSPVRPLGAGSVVRLIAPSGPFDHDSFAAGVAFLKGRYEVRHRPDILERKGFCAGTDERRTQELLEALADEDAGAIIAARGGYGATRLLPRLGIERIRQAAIPLVGFSDITALHSLWHHAGVPSVHGSMVAALGRASEAERSGWVEVLEGQSQPLSGLESWAAGDHGGVAEGPLVGGNIAVLGALVGTPHAPRLEGALLLLEDVGERPYRVDRMLTTLRQAGWLKAVAGVVVGELTDCQPGPDGVTVISVLQERLADLGVPVLGGLPVGHGSVNESLWLGRPYRLDAGAGTLEPAAKASGW